MKQIIIVLGLLVTAFLALLCALWLGLFPHARGWTSNRGLRLLIDVVRPQTDLKAQAWFEHEKQKAKESLIIKGGIEDVLTAEVETPVSESAKVPPKDTGGFVIPIEIMGNAPGRPAVEGVGKPATDRHAETPLADMGAEPPPITPPATAPHPVPRTGEVERPQPTPTVVMPRKAEEPSPSGLPPTRVEAPPPSVSKAHPPLSPEEFLTEHFAKVSRKDLNSVMEDYAGRVNYFGRGMVWWVDIWKDEEDDFKKNSAIKEVVQKVEVINAEALQYRVFTVNTTTRLVAPKSDPRLPLAPVPATQPVIISKKVENTFQLVREGDNLKIIAQFAKVLPP